LVEAIVCDERDVVTDDINIDADEQKEHEHVSSVKEMEDDDTTTTVGSCDENIVGKIVTSAEDSNSNNTTIDALIERGKNARRQRKYD
jgi:hypothetical protein